MIQSTLRFFATHPLPETSPSLQTIERIWPPTSTPWIFHSNGLFGGHRFRSRKFRRAYLLNLNSKPSARYDKSMSTKKVDERPEISSITSGPELRRWYWLKTELVNQAKECGVKTTGGKFVILDRIAHHLDTGEIKWPGDKAVKHSSKFDWHKDPLTPDTIITDSYKNSQNVRRFFHEHVGKNFKFNIEFMAWMKANIGKKLSDAVDEYHAMKKREASPDFQSKIADHNQFNQYTREFLADNPGLGLKDVRRIWALKRALPSENGRHEYDRADLLLE